MAKMYFAEFTNNRTGQVFQKFGHTGFNDAQKRLDRITEEFPHFSARVLAVVYHHNIDICRAVEETFKTIYPKNLMIEEKISGVTEIVNLTAEQRYKVIQHVRSLNEMYKSELFNDNN